MNKTIKHLLRGLRSMYVVLGVVLIWRGVWVILDFFDVLIFGEISLILAGVSILVGLFLLFKHDHKLDELGHL